MSSSPSVRKIFKSLAPTEKEANARASSQPGSQLVCPPGPAASTLARGGLLEQYRCTWEGLDGGVGGRVRVSFLSLPFPAALAVGNFHGALLLPRGLGCPVGSTNAKRQQRCFHGFVPGTNNSLLPPSFLPSPFAGPTACTGIRTGQARAPTPSRENRTRTVVESWDVHANLGNSSAFRMQNPDLPGYPPRTSRPPLVPFVDAPRESATDRAEGRRISI
ncbi:hypothetical protein CPAR01_05248 [Colletotrichum paranaense]|uniref:Uncharacterized protein n=1 Tax=Colletotrichum paranaense TaxID=1914294 RepID=A0ABQ9SQR9_9PEZI|nr:uncharacterized protein CPAR01_05248 [Colletotrichum paranaense]KAK1541861.1 hypothetical protein CPAR01_05248 [Colletotrichum paranaense]